MRELFPDEVVSNTEQEKPWKKSETDKMLDSYFTGAHPKRIAHAHCRNPKAIKRRIEQFVYNERERATLYEPFRRISRTGIRFTENEKILIREHQKRDVPPEATAKVLARDVEEIAPGDIGKAEIKSMRVLAPSLDLVLALRFAYHFHKKKVVSNKTYDALKEEELQFGGGKPELDRSFCPNYCRTLALYLIERMERVGDLRKREGS